MTKAKIQQLIDGEKAAFDFARMFLTTVAWWTLVIFLASAFFADPSAKMSFMWLIVVPFMLVAALFGLYLAFRLNVLTEGISAELFAQTNMLSSWWRWPARFVISMLPMACAWIVVWALIFANLPK